MEKFVFLFENNDYFDGALRFSTPLMFLNVGLLFYFLYSWFRLYKKTGWKIDFWHFIIFITFIVPVIFMYPFNASIYNIGAMGDFYEHVEPYINWAYIVTIIGYLSLLIGGLFYRFILFESPFCVIIYISRTIEKMINVNIHKKIGIRVVSFSLIFLLSGLLFFQIYYGYFGDPRSFFMANPYYRPVYNIILATIVFFLPMLFINILLYKNKVDLILFFFAVVLSFFSGTRGSALYPLVTCYIFYVFYNKGKASLIKIFFFAIIILLFAVFLSLMRGTEGIDFLNEISKISDHIFYRNNFSDTRDFAWVLAYWDGVYIQGKSYVAGLISFLPSYMSEYREVWSISRYTNSMVGFDSSIHPGLRPGMFGEAYLNFGIYGVIVLGFMAGSILRYVSMSIIYIMNRSRNISCAYSKIFIYVVISNFFMTAGFFNLYVFVFIAISMYIINFLTYGGIKDKKDVLR